MGPLLLGTFVAYFIIVLGIGIHFYNRMAKMKEYFIADRQLNPYVVALSAQASDMSGWLLMGLPGSILVAGVGEIWVGIGLAIGTYLAWRIIAKRLRIYSEKEGNSITICEFFSNRFDDGKGTLRTLCGIILLIFFTFYVSSAFVSGGKILLAIFPDAGYHTMMVACAAIIIANTFLGGFKAVCWTDFFQGILMFIAVVVVPMSLIGELGGIDEAMTAIKDIAGSDAAFNVDFLACGWVAILSGLAWGLGYFGMPHIQIRYMAIKDAKEIRISRRVATVWVVITLSCACLIGLIGRAWLESTGAYPLDNPENILIHVVNTLWTTSIPVFAGLVFAGIMAAVMSTADSQLLVASSSVSNDLSKRLTDKGLSDERLMLFSRATVIIIAVIAVFIAMDPASSIMKLASFAWAGFGAAFGPLMILSLFWRRTNRQGAIAGILTGFVTTVLWNTFLGSCILGSIFGVSGLVIDTPVTGVYELLPGFIIATLAIVIVSLLTDRPGDGIVATFNEVERECREDWTVYDCKFAAKMGIMAAIVFFVGLLCCRLLGGPDISGESIDDLLILGGVPMGAAFIAVVVGGFFVSMFGFGLTRSPEYYSRFAGILTIFASIFMMLAGIIDQGYGIHYILRNSALMIGAMALCLLCTKEIRERNSVTLGLCGIVAGIVATLWLMGALELSVAVTFGLMGCVAIQGFKQFGSGY